MREGPVEGEGGKQPLTTGTFFWKSLSKELVRHANITVISIDLELH